MADKKKAGTPNLNATDPHYEKPGTSDGTVASEAAVNAQKSSQSQSSASTASDSNAGQ